MSEPVASATHRRLVTRNFLVLGSGELIGRLIGFATMVYAARALQPESYGVIGFALAIILYFQSAVDGGLELYGPRLVAEGRDLPGDLLTTIVGSRLAVAAVSGLALLAFAWLALPSLEAEVLAFYGLTLLGFAISTRWIHVGLDRGLPVALSKLTYGVLTLVLVVLWVRGPADVTKVPIAYAVADLVGAIMLATWLFAIGVRPGRFRIELARRAWRGSAPLLATVLLGLLIFNADFILLRVFRGRAEVGLYLAAHALISFLGQLGNVARLSLIPTLSRVRDQPDIEAEVNASAFARVSLVALPVAVGGFLVGADLVRDLYGAEYDRAGLPLQILIWTIAGLLWRSLIEAFFIARDRQGLVLRATGFAAGLNLALNLVLIPLYGMPGAAAATLATEIVRLSITSRYASQIGYGRIAFARLRQPAVATAVMGLVLWWAPIADPWLRVGTGLVVFAVACIAVGVVRRDAVGKLTLAV